MAASIQFVSGEARLTLGGDIHEVKAGAFVHMPPQLVHGILAKTPVVLMSGVVNRAVAERAFAVKADELLRKPFQPQDLITRVKHLLTDAALGAIEMREHVVHEQVRPRAVVEHLVGRTGTKKIRNVLEVSCLRSRHAPTVAKADEQFVPRVPRRPQGKQNECRD